MTSQELIYGVNALDWLLDAKAGLKVLDNGLEEAVAIIATYEDFGRDNTVGRKLIKEALDIIITNYNIVIKDLNKTHFHLLAARKHMRDSYEQGNKPGD